jgi:hypothetical protein
MAVVDNSELVSAYAAQCNPALLGKHAVASPLGLWLLLALVGPVTEGAARRDLETVLGTTVDDAAVRAQAMLSEPHPAVSAVAAVWDRKLGPAFDEWARSLPDVVERGPVPNQAQANAWAQARTNGLIGEFPLQIDELTRLVLASALAADIAWATPLATTDDLGGEFGVLIAHALTLHFGIQLVAETDAAGLVAVAAPRASSALDVLSVIAAPDVMPADVDTAAHQVAAMLRGDERAARRMLVEELADGHAWTVTDRREQRFGGPSVQAEWRSHLPAWSATSNHDLMTAPGVPLVFDALTGFARAEDLPMDFSAKQTAVASYSKTGFKAAAVTAMAMVAAGVPTMPEKHEVLVRRIELRFNRSHAVLACAAQDEGPSAWRGVPVFSAWVTEPEETIVERPGPPQPVRIGPVT